MTKQQESKTIWSITIGNCTAICADVPQWNRPTTRQACFCVPTDFKDELWFYFHSGWGCSPEEITLEMLYSVAQHMIYQNADTCISETVWDYWQIIGPRSEWDCACCDCNVKELD